MIGLLCEKMGILDGLMVFVIGMLFVFASLAVMMGLIYLFKLFRVAPKKKEIPAEPAPVVETTPEPTAEECDDEELVAVITAAVASCLEQEHITAPFKVRKIKRIL